MIRIELPYHLRVLAGQIGDEMEIEVVGPLTTRSLLDSLEFVYPMLRGTIREHVTGRRRPFLRFFACGEDISHQAYDIPLPALVASGEEPFMIVGAIAGG